MKQKTPTEGTDHKLRSLTSLNQVEYESLLEIFEEEEVSVKLSTYTLKGGLRKRFVYKEQKNSSLYGDERKLEFMLMYMKENPNQSYQGYAFGMSQSKVSEWGHFLSPVLEESLKKMGFLPQNGTYYASQAEVADFTDGCYRAFCPQTE